ncbi:MAG: multiheme c-type cytochrome [Gammaproteobacteria bacterium]|nr:multiheme c-type cytochrome [Gammaproteobacteria bacterium]
MHIVTAAADSPPLSPSDVGANRHPGYVTSRVCADCHATQFESWRGSHHDLAMQSATAATVLGDFDAASFESNGVASRFFIRDGAYFVNTEGPDGKYADFPIKYTFGVEPLQQYLIEFPGGRLQSLTVAWDTQRESWFDLYPDERFTTDNPLHWTGLYQRWNFQCADCHSTDLLKNYDAQTDLYDTLWSDINVGCEACHGPGERHVNWARKDNVNDAQEYSNFGLSVNFDTASPHSLEACAGCHSRRHRISAENFRGQAYLDVFVPATLRAGLYHADGQILDEVYVYGSFLQSRMYQAGVVCSDCHDPHNLRPKAVGNDLCTRCHQQQRQVRFQSLTAASYDTPEHHHHESGTPGAACVNCHMPARTYMIVDPRRDHSFRVPRPDLSIKQHTPNACNNCHQSESPSWAAGHIDTWFGEQRRRAQHYGEILAAGRNRLSEALPMLAGLASDARQPAIVRATAIELLRGYGVQAINEMIQAVQDEDALVRATAVPGFGSADAQVRIANVAPLLSDPVRAVRIEAARLLAPLPKERLDEQQQQAMRRALAEFREAQLTTIDGPSSHFNIGVFYSALGRTPVAEQAYLTSLRLDPYFLPAAANLANLYNATGRNDAAESVLRDSLARDPEAGELHYSLGLLLAEQNKMTQSTAALGRASELLPGRARVHYNYALALQQTGRLFEAGITLRKALQLAPDDTQIVYALVAFYTQQQRWEEALPMAEKLVELAPDAPQPQQMLRDIRQQLMAE